jgi:hypothetical protein
MRIRLSDIKTYIVVLAILIMVKALATEAYSQITFERRTIDSNFGAFFVTTSDLDKDGDADVIAGRLQLAWFKNNGNANFTKYVLGNFTRLFSVFPVDLDKDGDIDLLTADIEETTIRFYKKSGSSYQEIHLIDNVQGAESVAAADFDKDGDLDIVVATLYSEQVFWCENKGNLNFDTRHVLETSFVRGHKIAVADLNDDGKMDIIGIAGGHPFCWWKNLGDKNFSERQISSVGGLGFCVNDMTGNGDLDLIHCNHYSGTVTLFTNNGSGSFTQRFVATNQNWPTWASAGDINKDGDNDFVFVAGGRRDGDPGELFWFENTGSNNFTQHAIADSRDGVLFMAELVDLDKDGDLDIVSGFERERKLYWWENKKGGSSESVSKPNTPNGSSTGTIGVDLLYSTGGSSSNLGHTVEYRFDWGDGD